MSLQPSVTNWTVLQLIYNCARDMNSVQWITVNNQVFDVHIHDEHVAGMLYGLQCAASKRTGDCSSGFNASDWETNRSRHRCPRNVSCKWHLPANLKGLSLLVYNQGVNLTTEVKVRTSKRTPSHNVLNVLIFFASCLETHIGLTWRCDSRAWRNITIRNGCAHS